MKIKRIDPGFGCSNTYIVWDEKSGDGVMVDPGGFAEKLIAEAVGVNIKYIVLTHSHFDHIGALEKVAQITGAPVVIYKDEALALTDPKYNLSRLAGVPENKKEADITVSDGETLCVGDIQLKFIHTPGHTKGCMCMFVGEKDLITGDTLFNGSIGRTDFEGGDFAQMKESLAKLCRLDDDVKIYPGHGEESTIGFEKMTNPYLV